MGDFLTTFEKGVNEKGEPYITCLVCKRTSYNQNDIDREYCGCCHQFHNVLTELERLKMFNNSLRKSGITKGENSAG